MIGMNTRNNTNISAVTVKAVMSLPSVKKNVREYARRVRIMTGILKTTFLSVGSNLLA
jgi:hypothetical protein